MDSYRYELEHNYARRGMRHADDEQQFSSRERTMHFRHMSEGHRPGREAHTSRYEVKDMSCYREDMDNDLSYDEADSMATPEFEKRTVNQMHQHRRSQGSGQYRDQPSALQRSTQPGARGRNPPRPPRHDTASEYYDDVHATLGMLQRQSYMQPPISHSLNWHQLRLEQEIAAAEVLQQRDLELSMRMRAQDLARLRVQQRFMPLC